MRAREQAGGLTGEMAAAIEPSVKPGVVYADYVELRIRDLAKKDRARRGLTRSSPEIDRAGRAGRRELAWPEIVALVASVVLFLVAAPARRA